MKHRIDPKTLTATSGMTPAHLAAKVQLIHFEQYNTQEDSHSGCGSSDNDGVHINVTTMTTDSAVTVLSVASTFTVM